MILSLNSVPKLSLLHSWNNVDSPCWLLVEEGTQQYPMTELAVFLALPRALLCTKHVRVLMVQLTTNKDQNHLLAFKRTLAYIPIFKHSFNSMPVWHKTVVQSVLNIAEMQLFWMAKKTNKTHSFSFIHSPTPH